MTIDHRVTELETRMALVESEIENLNTELNTGAGDRPSLRYRVHQIEQFNAAAKAAEAAKDALRATLEVGHGARDRRLMLYVSGLNVLVVALGVLASFLLLHK